MSACHLESDQSNYKLKFELLDYRRVRHGMSGLCVVREMHEFEYLDEVRGSGATMGMLAGDVLR